MTGHSGFKGSWLMLWLKHLGAEVKGFSLPPPTEPSHIMLLDAYDSLMVGDIRNKDQFMRSFVDFEPEIVFHLAAQPLVRKSYADPVDTFLTNMMGSVHMLEAARLCRSVRAVVNITTDKVYRNIESLYAYKETDIIGGQDPYSTSKACVELIHQSYSKSFLADCGIRSATARAGNVVGGGDWAEDRLVPDVMKAAAVNEVTQVRNPHSVRPWQHVLDPLSGYLLLGQKLLDGDEAAEGAWNFGPDQHEDLSVQDVLLEMKNTWKEIEWKDVSENHQVHEFKLLSLDCTKANQLLQWSPVWDTKTTLLRTAQWYRDYYRKGVIGSREDLRQYIDDARNKGVVWTR